MSRAVRFLVCYEGLMELQEMKAVKLIALTCYWKTFCCMERSHDLILPNKKPSLVDLL